MILTLPWYLGNSRTYSDFGGGWMWGVRGLIFPLILWSAVWTGLALWHAARREEKWWFIFFLFVHTAGIVEIIYLLVVAKAFKNRTSRKAHRK